MFYRRKLILALLQAFDNQLEKLSLQKLLFLFTQQQGTPSYDFVPYKFGCYSFSANADLKAMVTQASLSEEENFLTKKDKADYISNLTDQDKKNLVSIKELYGGLSENDLMKITYLSHHYYAINSIKAKEVLSGQDYQKVLDAKPKNGNVVLYTIGYEGVSLETYLNKLIKNDIRVLVDVRNNPMSMKFGFSKSQLKNYCNSLNIKYEHVPEVGIQSELRQQLKTQSDYDVLFEKYRKINLAKTLVYQERILKLLIEEKRIALTCFEANICQCHRKHLAEAITQLPEWKYKLEHI
jgi:hypothetical protein